MGAPRCQSCNLLCGLDTQEPEIEDSDLTSTYDEGSKEHTLDITATIKIMRQSACCGEDTKEYTFEVEGTFTVNGHEGEDHEFELDEGMIELTEKSGGRYKKSYIGFHWSPSVTCSCKQEVTVQEDGGLEMEDEVAASEFEELY